MPPEGEQLIPGRPYSLQNEAKLILRSVGALTSIGSGRTAGRIVTGIKAAVDKAMSEAEKEIAGATTELVAEIRDGSGAVKAAIKQEIAMVREQFGEVIGNAAAAAAEAVEEAKEVRPTNGTSPP
jgi:uncharacterized protein YjbJ (UPF0337 family)